MTGRQPADDGVFHVLMVCSANICRSPAAALLLDGALGATGDIRISSAGLRARVGAPLDPAIAELLGTAVAPPFAARQLIPDMVRAADLVLTMTRAQRSALAAWVPSAVRRSFTLQEFADLAVLCRDRGALGAQQSARRALAAVVAEGPRLRAYRTVDDRDDIADPYGKDRSSYVAAVRRITVAVDTLATTLRGDPDSFAALANSGDNT